MNALAHAFIDVLEVALHGPESGVIGAAQHCSLALEALADAGVGIVLVPLPTLQEGLAHAVQTGAIPLEIAPKSPVQEALGVITRNGSMLKVKLELSVDIGEFHAT